MPPSVKSFASKTNTAWLRRLLPATIFWTNCKTNAIFSQGRLDDCCQPENKSPAPYLKSWHSWQLSGSAFDNLLVQIGMKKSILANTQEECKSLKSTLEEQRLHTGGFRAAAKQDLKVCGRLLGMFDRTDKPDLEIEPHVEINISQDCATNAACFLLFFRSFGDLLTVPAQDGV